MNIAAIQNLEQDQLAVVYEAPALKDAPVQFLRGAYSDTELQNVVREAFARQGNAVLVSMRGHEAVGVGVAMPDVDDSAMRKKIARFSPCFNYDAARTNPDYCVMMTHDEKQVSGIAVFGRTTRRLQFYYADTPAAAQVLMNIINAGIRHD